MKYEDEWFRIFKMLPPGECVRDWKWLRRVVEEIEEERKIFSRSESQRKNLNTP